MDEKDLERIEQLLIKIVDAKLENVSNRFDAKLEDSFLRYDAKLEQFKHEIIAEFNHQITLQTEGFQHGLTVVAESHQMLSEKLERVEAGLDKKLDAIVIDLSAHWADTESHHGVYRVK